MRKIFPFSFSGRNMRSVICSTLIYTLIFIFFAIIAFIFKIAAPDAVYTVVNIIRQAALLYCVGGVIAAVLYAAEAIK